MITLFLKKISELLQKDSTFNALVDTLLKKDFSVEIEGPKGFFLSLILKELLRYSKGNFFILVPTEKEAESLYRDLSLFSHDVLLFPWWGTLPYKGDVPQTSTHGQRIFSLVKLLTQRKSFIVISLRAFLNPVVPSSLLRDKILVVKKGAVIDPVKIERTLQGFGYLRVPSVTVHGEFALRGEVLDVFMSGQEEALRVVFEWDTVEEIKFFNPISQESTGKMESIALYPATEIIWSDERIDGLQNYLTRLDGEKTGPSRELVEKLLETLREKRECLEQELFFFLSFEKLHTILDYRDEDSILILLEKERLESTYQIIKKEYHQLYYKGLPENALYPPAQDILADYPTLIQNEQRKVLFPVIKHSRPLQNSFSFLCESARSFFGNIVYLKEELSNLIKSGYTIFVFSESEIQGERIRHILKDFDIQIIPESISAGFTLPELKIIVIQENEIFGRKKRIPLSIKKAKSKALDTFVELSPGNYVVHLNYGIGRFSGIERIKAAGTERDYMKLEYADQEVIFIPIEQVNLVQRYIGNEGSSPKLDKIGGKSWEKRKAKTRKSVEDLAERLLKIYSQRKTTRGFAFPRDPDWQLEFEAAFPFQETEDQLKCIEEVKQDMEGLQPMDRLVCGDVGYGKTEIAMRAAFKAVMAGKQAVILAPTTILVEQHYENFLERFKQFPVNIAMISRFVTKSSQKKIVAEMKEGSIDLLIGTHRILQKDVAFKNLGLLVIDEEQRFGVKDKERFKEMKHSIDCLSLSATPIPRTLHMSLLKIRDMSVLATPPYNRRPIETLIQEFDEQAVAKAIRKEVARGGQVFFLHNRVETLEGIQLFLQKVVPELLVEVAHGQMNSRELEDIMHRFIHGGFHVLLATTIIENGIDIPNVNTIIIDRADMYGVSQLYQLRGRVGRSDRVAYAYLLYPEKRALTELAMKRLQIISDFTELGSGFKIALKDLEIRGAGNLLGREQSGDIVAVGFDLYLKLLDEAVRELSAEREEHPPEVYLELDYSGYIPDGYIKEPSEKIEIYKKISGITTEEELTRVSVELEDRFGPMPDTVHSLLSIAEIRIICARLWVSALRERRGQVEVEFARVSEVPVDKVLRLIKESAGNVKINPATPHVLLMKTGAIGLSEKSEFIRDRLSRLL